MKVLDVLSYGGQVTLIGLLIVFVGLLILIISITLMGKIFKAITAKNEQKAQTPAPAPVQAAAPAPVIEEKIEEPVIDDGAIDPQVIAVIAAAIAAYDSNRNLVVRSVRRAAGWKKAARDEMVCRF